MNVLESPRRFGPSTIWLVLFLVSQANLTRFIGALNPSFFEMQFAFSPAKYSEILQAWGPTGVTLYRLHFSYDLIHPLIFGALGWVAVQTSPVFDGLTVTKERFYRWLLPVAAGFDYIENTCQLKLLSFPTGIVDWLVPVSATCASIKWILAFGFTLVFVWRLLQWGVRHEARFNVPLILSHEEPRRARGKTTGWLGSNR